MGKSVVFIILGLVLFNCSPKKSQKAAGQQPQYLKFDSAVKYQFSVLPADQAALVNPDPVSWEQLTSQDVALQELESKMINHALEFTYAWGLMQFEKTQQPVEIKFHGGVSPADLKTIVSGAGLEWNDKVTLVNAEVTRQGVLAETTAAKVTWDEFWASHMKYSRNYERVFRQRLQRLNGIVVRRFLLKAARAENIPMEQYVQKYIVQAQAEPTDDEVKAFANGRGISDSDLNEDMIKRLRPIMVQSGRDKKIEAYVAKNLIKQPIQVSFPQPVIKVKSPELGENVPQWGKSESPSFVYVGHWNCRECPDSLRSFLQAKKEWGGKVKGAFIYSFPDRDREARMGAEAALCVREQSEGSFWTFLAQIMAESGDVGIEQQLNNAAKASGVDYQQFRSCFLTRAHQKDVNAHLAMAKNIGVTSAPLMIFQGQVLSLPLDTSAISAKLKSVGGSMKNKGLWARIKAFFGF